jgi:hypothetical protein
VSWTIATGVEGLFGTTTHAVSEIVPVLCVEIAVGMALLFCAQPTTNIVAKTANSPTNKPRHFLDLMWSSFC